MRTQAVAACGHVPLQQTGHRRGDPDAGRGSAGQLARRVGRGVPVDRPGRRGHFRRADRTRRRVVVQAQQGRRRVRPGRAGGAAARGKPGGGPAAPGSGRRRPPGPGGAGGPRRASTSAPKTRTGRRTAPSRPCPTCAGTTPTCASSISTAMATRTCSSRSRTCSRGIRRWPRKASGRPQRTVQPRDEADGPRLVFADGTNAIFLADMSGDGLADLVRISNGEVCYWPNLGYGRFGGKVDMDDAPRFDHPTSSTSRASAWPTSTAAARRISSTWAVTACKSTSTSPATRWSAPCPSRTSPGDNLSAVSTVDLLGNGTACLVWSSPLPGDAAAPLRYIDLVPGGKPHLLVEVRNNLGGETGSITHRRRGSTSRTSATGGPWITRLPFPVHVVSAWRPSTG